MADQDCSQCGKSFDPRSAILQPTPASTGVECPKCGSWEKLPVTVSMLRSGCAGTVGQEVAARIEELVLSLYQALDDASGVVDAGEGEAYAYENQLRSGAAFLGIER